MSFQIQSIMIYNHDYNSRIIEFYKNRLNIITGDSDTGKSSIISIIDYCLCSGKCETKDLVRNLVSYYGIHIVNSDSGLIILRKAPNDNKESSGDFFMIEGIDIKFPKNKDEFNKLFPCKLEYIKKKITEFISIDDYHSEVSGSVNIRHSLPFCILNYNDLANDKIIFHNQDNTFKKIAIQNFLPYFLDIYSIDIIDDMEKLKKLNSDLYDKNRKNNLPQFIEKIKDELNSLKINIDELDTLDKILENIEKYIDINNLFISERNNILYSISKSEKNISNLKLKLKSLKEIQALISDNYNNELIYGYNIKKCPLCNNDIKDENKINMKYIQEDIDKVYKNYAAINDRIKNIQKDIDKEKIYLNEYRNQLLEIPNIENENIVLKILEIKLKIEDFFSKHSSNSEKEIKNLKEQINSLRNNIDKNKSENTDKIIDKLNELFSDIFKQITGDDANIYLDINRLIFIKDGDVMSGGASNIIIQKLSILLGLHQYFINRNRPVPSFLVIDQISQSNSGNTPEDEKTIKSILKVFYEIKNFQIILLEHVNYEDEKFKNSVCENWYNGEKLLPYDWIIGK
ncbi:DUF3732 domain-containing protein [Brachyspira pilosicoli]|uniref:DUF3732 domain-containing protein n=2 Tax=Brachyspira pilosicoli TaxID=52584 RepID=UPI0012F5000E|nr:DUF3732 domain-containing protein [Brachyspira pilosicoli]